jgi:hypothetical protein
MRRISLALLAISTLVSLNPAPSTASDEPLSIAVVVVADADGVRIVSARPGRRHSTWSGVAVDVAPRRVRIAEWLQPDGTMQGGPVELDGAAARVFVSVDQVGQRLPVRVDGVLHELLIPALDEERGGDPKPPEPQLVTLQESGDSEQRQDMVFLSEGYLEGDVDTFLADVDTSLAYLATLEPYDRYLPLINVHAVFLPSNEAGADHLETAPQTYVDTALNCHFGAYDIDRLLDCDPARVAALAAAAPGDEVRIVLVNDPAYGGSGGADFAVASTHEEMPRIVAHEMGHSDGELRDEYDYGYGSGGAEEEYPNCHWAATGTPWQAWIDEGSPGVDAFHPCGYSDYFSPTADDCMMNTLQDHFCVVCREQLARTILQYVDSMIVGMTPATGVLEEPVPWNGVATLSLDLLTVNGEGLTVIWDWVEGDEEIARGPNLSTIDIGGLDLDRGVQTIRVRVQDRIGWVITGVPGAMVGEVQFQVEFMDAGGSDDDDDDDDDDGGGGCQGSSDDGGEGCGGDDDDGGGFSRAGLPLVVPLLLLGRRRRRLQR